MSETHAEAANSDLAVRQVCKTFPTAAAPLTVLSGVDLSLSRGEDLAITGPSGSGKSTLLYIIGLLEEPTSGGLRIGGEDPLALDAAGQAQFRNQRIGFVFQDHHLRAKPVLENVLLPTIAGSGTADAESGHGGVAIGLSERLDIAPCAFRRSGTSGLAGRSSQPALLLADEPTGNLDRRTAEAVGTLLLDVAREQQTMLICVTHSIELAGRFSRRTELQDGQLVELEAAAP